jgi:hypothetical protein
MASVSSSSIHGSARSGYSFRWRRLTYSERANRIAANQHLQGLIRRRRNGREDERPFRTISAAALGDRAPVNAGAM